MSPAINHPYSRETSRSKIPVILCAAKPQVFRSTLFAHNVETNSKGKAIPEGVSAEGSSSLQAAEMLAQTYAAFRTGSPQPFSRSLELPSIINDDCVTDTPCVLSLLGCGEVRKSQLLQSTPDRMVLRSEPRKSGLTQFALGCQVEAPEFASISKTVTSSCQELPAKFFVSALLAMLYRSMVLRVISANLLTLKRKQKPSLQDLKR